MLRGSPVSMTRPTSTARPTTHGQGDRGTPDPTGSAPGLEAVLGGPGAGGGAHAQDRPADLEDGQDDDRHQGHPLDDAEVHHLADHDPAVGVDDRPEEPGQRPYPVLAEQPVRAEAGDPVDGRHVEHPGADGREHHEQEGERKEGSGVHAAEEWASAPDERVPQGQVALAEELPGKGPQGEVLDQVVARERRGVAQRRHDECHQGHEQQHRGHPPVVGPQQAAQAAKRSPRTWISAGGAGPEPGAPATGRSDPAAAQRWCPSDQTCRAEVLRASGEVV